MKNQKTIKLSALREVAVMVASLLCYRKAMGFRADSAITRLVEDIKAQIRYEIGEELDKVAQAMSVEIEKIRKPFSEEAIGKTEKEVVDINRRLNAEISKSTTVIELQAMEAPLWDTEVKYEIKPVEVEDLDYSERFSDERKPVEFMGRTYRIDGYTSLLQLVQDGVIVIKETTE